MVVKYLDEHLKNVQIHRKKNKRWPPDHLEVAEYIIIFGEQVADCQF